ncbi:MAG: Holliday junction branch migration protein RuvA [Muricoprocola sp.]
MIAFLKGTVCSIKSNMIILEVSGMGYRVFMTLRDMETLRRGQEVLVHTYLQVREDAMQLFGFLSESDLEVFQLLLNVNGIGPKGALGILTALSSSDLKFAVLAGDAKAISKAPGIGNKTAQKLILELKDKFNMDDFYEDSKEAKEDSYIPSGDLLIRDEAVQALTALGYPAAEALKAVNAVLNEGLSTTEDLLKAALKKMVF